MRWRIRANVRTSDWFVKVLDRLAAFVPQGWRGTRKERTLRRLMTEYVLNRIHDGIADYDHHGQVMHELHLRAERQALRSFPLSDLRQLLGQESEPIGADHLDDEAAEEDEV